MIIQATNNTLTDIVLTDLSGYALFPNTPVDLGTVFNIYQVAQSNVLVNNIATGAVIINNGIYDLEITEAIRYVSLLIGASGNGITELTGDIVADVSGSAVATIAVGAVTLSKMANLAPNSIIGNNTENPNTPIALNPTQVKSLLSITASDVANLTSDLAAKVNTTQLNIPNGVATLDSSSNLAQGVDWSHVRNAPASYVPLLHAATHESDGIDVISHQNLSGSGVNTHSQIDTALTRLFNTSGLNTGDQDLSGLVLKTTTVNGHALSDNVAITASDIGLDNVLNAPQVTVSQMGVADGVATLDSASHIVQGISWANIFDAPSLATAIHATTHELGGTDVISHQNLTGAGTNDHIEIDTALTRLVNTSGTNTGDQDLTIYSYSLCTGIITKGLITINSLDNTKIDITAGTSLYVDDSDSANPVVEVLSWTDQTITPPNLDTNGRLWIGISRIASGIGSFTFSTEFTPNQRRTIAILGRVWGNGTTVVEGVGQYSYPAFGYEKTLEDLMNTFGTMNRSGNVFSAHSGALLLDKTGGESFRFAAGSGVDFTSPNILTDNPQTPIDAYHYHLALGSEFTTLSATIDPNNYDVSGVLTSVPEGKFTIQRVFYYPRSGVVDVAYGQRLYNSLSEATANVNSGNFVINAGNKRSLEGSVLRAWLIVAQGATDLGDPSQATVISSGGMGTFNSFSPVTLVDSVNGYTGTVNLTTNDVADSNDKRYITEAQKTVLQNTSGVNTGDQTLDSLGLGTSAIPNFADAILSELGISTNIVTSNHIAESILELDNSIYALQETGFGGWTSGTNSNTYEIVDGKFQINRSGYGYILGKKISWISGIQTGILPANTGIWIYVDTSGNLYNTSNYAPHKIMLFQVLYDGTYYFVKKENHPQSFPSQVSSYCHNAIGNIFFGNGAVIAKVGTGTGLSADDRHVKIVGADTLSDHGISTTIPDSAGSGNTVIR